MSDPRFEDLPDTIAPLARFASIVAVTGGHSALFVGWPGTGKTMLARRACRVLPALAGDTEREHIHAHRVSRGEYEPHGAVLPPVRMPHHTVSLGGMVGTRPGKLQPLPPGHAGPLYRSPPRPGELGLAHGGVLFLDECPEFSHNVLAAVGEAHRDGQTVAINLSEAATVWPTRFALLAATDPCPCGFAGHPERACICPPASRARYLRRLRPLPFEIVVRMGEPAERQPAPRLGCIDSDAIAGAVAVARRVLAKLGRRPTLRETITALGYSAPEPIAVALERGRDELEAVMRTGESVCAGGVA